MEEKDVNVQWHPGFVAAINLELAQNRNDLIFEKEYNLNTKPLEIDLLVVKKNASVRIENEIGRLFRGHNILEYKSPEDHLDIDSFYKVVAYASLYKSYGAAVDAIKADDVTVTLIREAKPEGLFRYFRKQGYRLSRLYSGIYYVEGKVLFPTQIIVTRELDPRSHVWLKALSKSLREEDFQNLQRRVIGLTGKLDKELASSVVRVSVGANRQIVDEWEGGTEMYDVLLEVMEPLIQQREQELTEKVMKRGIEQGIEQGRKQGRQQSIRVTIDMLREFGHEEAEIKKAVMRKYELPLEEVEGYL